MQLDGKSIAVTGVSSGIGAATAIALAQAGAKVIGIDRNETPEFSGQLILADLSCADEVSRLGEEIHGPLDGLINIAGVPGTAPWRTVLSVNVLALRDLTNEMLPKIAPGGFVVNLASGVANDWEQRLDDLHRFITTRSWDEALETVAGQPDVVGASYRFSKECVRALTTQNAVVNLHRRIRFNSVSPGPVLTPIFNDFKIDHGAAKVDAAVAATGRSGLPDDIADVVRFLASRQSRWINGSDISVDGGLSAYRGRMGALSLQGDLDQRTESVPSAIPDGRALTGREG